MDQNNLNDEAGEREREREEWLAEGKRKLAELRDRGVLLKASDLLRSQREMVVDDAAKLCRMVAPELLVETMLMAFNRTNTVSERLNATKLLLERGYGRPTQQVSVEGVVDIHHLHLNAVRELAGRARGEVIDLVAAHEAENSHNGVSVDPEPKPEPEPEPELEPKPVASSVSGAEVSSQEQNKATTHADWRPSAQPAEPESGRRKRFKPVL